MRFFWDYDMRKTLDGAEKVSQIMVHQGTARIWAGNLPKRDLEPSFEPCSLEMQSWDGNLNHLAVKIPFQTISNQTRDFLVVMKKVLISTRGLTRVWGAQLPPPQHWGDPGTFGDTY